MPCFHCNDTNACNCVECGKETLEGWKPGPCGWCEGRRKTQAFYERFPMINPEDLRWWTVQRQTTGGCHRVLLPKLQLTRVEK